ncbi:fungal-specific transcription factor domain-containing protein [Pyrenochaeta sp. MPI-SDFR-AT-0127]|nr:fungal-specific transcription factor domain-containing protein [Pyrenochaeta sp. MPI-SDFR-AT-0127]
MQNSSAGPSNYGKGKVAIPKLDRRQLSPPKSREKPKEHRTTRACKTCRKRKVRCSGEVPRCTNCRTNDLNCVYEQARRDRLRDAIQLNQDYISLLRDLSERVDDDDKQKISDAIDAAEDDLISPIATLSINSLGKRARMQFSLEDEVESGQHGEALVTASVGSNEDLDFLGEDLLRSRESRETGYIGQNSEVQWLRSVQRQTERATAEPYGMRYGPPGTNKAAVQQRSDALHERMNDSRQGSRKGSMNNITDATFYLDSDSIDVDTAVDPYEVPDPALAQKLFNCYMDTVHSSFPLVPASFEDQFQRFLESIRRHRPFQIPDKWRAIMNLLFAIGARYSHLTEAEFRGDERDHLIYMTRATRLLGMKNTAIFISGPDLALVEATGLLSFYFLVIGHVSRAWTMVGISIRFALSLGLHLRNEDPRAEDSKRESLMMIWWSLHAIECIVSSITGRPPIVSIEDCTVALPEIREQDTPNERSATQMRTNAPSPTKTVHPYFISHIKESLISQKVLLCLYSPRTAAHSWEAIQSKISELLNELEDWKMFALPQDSSAQSTHRDFDLEREPFLLRIQYWSTTLLITRPCLCRIERRIPHQSDRSANFNAKAAQACVDAALEVVKLFPDEPDPKFIYSSGPWWTIVHVIMQSMAVLLLEMAYDATHMQDRKEDLTASIKKLIRWLRAMQHNDPVAGRAYQVVWRILKTCTPALQSQANELLAESPEVSPHAQPSHFFHSPVAQAQPGLRQPLDFDGQLTDESRMYDPQLYHQRPGDAYSEYQPALNPPFSLDKTTQDMNFGNLFVTSFDQGAPVVNMNDLWSQSGASDHQPMDLYSMDNAPSQHQDYTQQQLEQMQQMQQNTNMENPYLPQ